MRECIYCGRTLEKDEKCSCAMSVSKRMEKERESEEKKETKKEKRPKQKKERKKREYNFKARNNRSFNSSGVMRELWSHFVSFIKSPIETVMNPGSMSKTVILLFAAFEGIIGGLCVYSVLSGASRGAFRFLAYLMGLGGMKGFATLKGFLLSAFAGSVSGIVIFFIYSGIFYIVNRWLFKQFTPYWEFVKRFAFAALPVSIIGAAGVILGIFSQITFASLLLCGMVGSLIITYEILRSVWYSKSPTKIMYTMMASIFVFLSVLMSFIRFA